MFFSEYFKRFSNNFFWNNSGGCFWLCFSTRIFRKESRDISFEFISLFHVQYKSLQVCHQSQEHLSFLQNLLNFIITKYFKQEVDDDLSLCVVERSHCGLYNWRYKDLSMSLDEKVVMLLWRSALWTSLTELLFLPKFDNNSPFVTQDQEIYHVIMS